jgi:hypothetical protein
MTVDAGARMAEVRQQAFTVSNLLLNACERPLVHES